MCFNSRAHEGRDKHQFADTDPIQVSIHAPTRGATSIWRLRLGRHVFQFTRPRGARPGADGTVPGQGGFNSRAHEGRDCGYHKLPETKHSGVDFRKPYKKDAIM